MKLTKECVTERKLTNEEMEKVFYANENIRNMCRERIRLSDSDFIDDIIMGLKECKCDYSLGGCSRSYLTTNHGKEFEMLNALLEIQKNYGFMNDEATDSIEFLLQKYDELQLIEDGSEYYEAYDEFASEVQNICQIFANQADEELNYYYTDEELLGVFYDYEEEFTIDESEVLPYLD